MFHLRSQHVNRDCQYGNPQHVNRGVTVLTRCVCVQAGPQGSVHQRRSRNGGAATADRTVDSLSIVSSLTSCLKRHIQLLALEQAAHARRNLELRTQIVQQYEMAHNAQSTQWQQFVAPAAQQVKVCQVDLCLLLCIGCDSHCESHCEKRKQKKET